MPKLNEAALKKALAPMAAILKGWSTCDRATLAGKVADATAEIDRLKAADGPWRKAKSDAGAMFKRHHSLNLS